ncbi:MAG: hypothetical protein QME40_07470 [bacterium]|nr:hypothetical protein [bacterium]
MDILNLISLVVGTVISIAGIWIGYKIAKKSGAFRKVKLDISLMNQSLIPDPQFEQIIYGYSVEENAIALCILPFMIKNAGELSAKNVNIRLAIPLGLREFKASIDEEELFKRMDIFGGYDKSDIKRRAYKFGGVRHIDYVIPAINPRSSVVIEEAIDITNASGMPFKVNAISKDGVPLQVKGYLKWSAPSIYVGVSATDVEPIGGYFWVRSYQVKDKEELGEKIMEDETQALREELSKIGAPKGFVSKVYAPGISKKAIVIIPKLEKALKPKAYATIKRPIYMEEPEKSERWLIGNVKKK